MAFWSGNGKRVKPPGNPHKDTARDTLPEYHPNDSGGKECSGREQFLKRAAWLPRPP